MEISEDTQAVVDYLDHYTEHNLRKKNDVAVIFELAAQALNDELITHLSFHGSAMWKVFGLMRKSTPGSEGFALLEQEFAASMNEIRTTIETLCEHPAAANDEAMLTRFHEVYLGLSAGVIRNITDLAHDLAQFKDMQNQLRRGES